MKAITLILLMSVVTINSQSQRQDTFEKYIDKPAIYYGIVSPDSVLYTYSRGSRSVNSNQPIDENSQFALFSITKTFTAIAILQLVEQGEISLEDKASDYLPNYSYLNEITIRQLMAHQSGLNNPMPMNWIHLAEENEAFNYAKFSNEILQKKAKVKYKPGKKAAYSNLNFLLLGEIIEQVTAMSYRQYVMNHILIRNDNISFNWNDGQAVTGYNSAGFSACLLGLLIDKQKYTEPKEGNLIPFKKAYLNGLAYGGLLANASGLNQFLQELLKPNNQILSPNSIEEMFTEQKLANGKLSGHSLGWFTGILNGKKYVHHAGGGGGFYLEWRIYPELCVATYVLTNKSGFSDRRILDDIDAKLLEINL